MSLETSFSNLVLTIAALEQAVKDGLTVAQDLDVEAHEAPTPVTDAIVEFEEVGSDVRRAANLASQAKSAVVTTLDMKKAWDLLISCQGQVDAIESRLRSLSRPQRFDSLRSFDPAFTAWVDAVSPGVSQCVLALEAVRPHLLECVKGLKELDEARAQLSAPLKPHDPADTILPEDTAKEELVKDDTRTDEPIDDEPEGIDTMDHVLIEEVSPSGVGGSPGGPDLDVLIDNRMREILGGLPSNPKEFLDALEKSFVIVGGEGQTKVEWRKGRTGVRDASSGLSLAEARLLQRATDVRDDIAEMLAELVPVVSSSDVSELERTISIFRSELDALVEDFSRLRFDEEIIDGRFSMLDATIDKIGYALGLTPNDKDMEREVQTLEEDRILNNYETIKDELGIVRRHWINFRDRKLKSLTAQMADLTTALAGVDESIGSVRAAIASTSLGALTRSIRIGKDVDLSEKDNRPIYLDAFLDWIEDSVTEKFPNVIAASGVDAVSKIVVPGIERMIRRVQDKVEHPLWKLWRVRVAWEELIKSLERASGSAKAIDARTKRRSKPRPKGAQAPAGAK